MVLPVPPNAKAKGRKNPCKEIFIQLGQLHRFTPRGAVALRPKTAPRPKM
jgi:hypothetical protein